MAELPVIIQSNVEIETMNPAMFLCVFRMNCRGKLILPVLTHVCIVYVILVQMVSRWDLQGFNMRETWHHAKQRNALVMLTTDNSEMAINNVYYIAKFRG